jgi:hypothetical protein
MDSITKKKIILVSVLLVIIFAAICVVWFISSQERPSNTQTPIKNFDNLVKNFPDDKKKNIYQALAIIIKYNNQDKNIDMNKIDDAVIRKGSEKQDEVKKDTNYTGSFIVDIESLKQSYRINYVYSNDQNSNFASGYPIIASCLEESELIYGYFKCEQPNAQLRESGDKLLKLLPYNSPYYTITGIPATSTDSKPTIVIQIMSTYNSERTRKTFMTYKDQALAWIKEQGVSIDDYTVRYRNLLNQEVILDVPAGQQGD